MKHQRQQSDLTLMQLHARALFTHDRRGRIGRVNERNGVRAPRFFLGRTVHYHVEYRFRDDLEDRVIAELRAIDKPRPPGVGATPLLPVNPEPFAHVLSKYAPVQTVWTGASFRFSSLPERAGSAVLIRDTNADLLEPHLESWLDAIHDSQPLVAIILDGSAVSVCGSVRITAEAHEAGVETATPFRRRGFGEAAVSAWAKYVVRKGAVPLYSTSWQNEASRALAAKLRLVQYGSVMHIT